MYSAGEMVQRACIEMHARVVGWWSGGKMKKMDFRELKNTSLRPPHAECILSVAEQHLHVLGVRFATRYYTFEFGDNFKR